MQNINDIRKKTFKYSVLTFLLLLLCFIAIYFFKESETISVNTYREPYFKYSIEYPAEWESFKSVERYAMDTKTPPPYAFSIIRFSFDGNHTKHDNCLAFQATPEHYPVTNNLKFDELKSDNNKQINLYGQDKDQKVYLEIEFEDKHYTAYIKMNKEYFVKYKKQIYEVIKSFKYPENG